MIKWNSRALRAALALSAISAYVVTSGASMRWW
jgi:hypothetical protein